MQINVRTQRREKSLPLPGDVQDPSSLAAGSLQPSEVHRTVGPPVMGPLCPRWSCRCKTADLWSAISLEQQLEGSISRLPCVSSGATLPARTIWLRGTVVLHGHSGARWLGLGSLASAAKVFPPGEWASPHRWGSGKPPHTRAWACQLGEYQLLLLVTVPLSSPSSLTLSIAKTRCHLGGAVEVDTTTSSSTTWTYVSHRWAGRDGGDKG